MCFVVAFPFTIHCYTNASRFAHVGDWKFWPSKINSLDEYNNEEKILDNTSTVHPQFKTSSYDSPVGSGQIYVYTVKSSGQLCTMPAVHGVVVATL